MIPKLKEAKVIRVNKNKDAILVWYGGIEIKEIDINTHEEQTHEVYDPKKPDFPTYMQVKRRMREIILEDQPNE
jgi:hypothetical protein